MSEPLQEKLFDDADDDEDPSLLNIPDFVGRTERENGTRKHEASTSLLPGSNPKALAHEVVRDQRSNSARIDIEVYGGKPMLIKLSTDLLRTIFDALDLPHSVSLGLSCKSLYGVYKMHYPGRVPLCTSLDCKRYGNALHHSWEFDLGIHLHLHTLLEGWRGTGGRVYDHVTRRFVSTENFNKLMNRRHGTLGRIKPKSWKSEKYLFPKWELEYREELGVLEEEKRKFGTEESSSLGISIPSAGLEKALKLSRDSKEVTFRNLE